MTYPQKQLNKMTLGEIAAQIPGATNVFRRYDMDFCCAGKQSLDDALVHKGLDQNTVVNELNALMALRQTPAADSDKSGMPDTATDTATLINFIISRFHDVHRKQFPELIHLSRKVEKVHADHPLCPKGLETHLLEMSSELLGHMNKEENILFPMMLIGDKELVAGPISMMEREHEEHGRALMEIRNLTHGGSLPDHACNTWRALYQGLAQLEEDLMQHIHLENNILFRR